MFWQESPEETAVAIPDDVVDVLFSLQCRSLPVDHAWGLSQALLRLAPWLEGTPECAVHTVHVAGSQNGWERPAAASGQHLLLSRRTRLAIRVPRARLATLKSALEEQDLEVAGCPLHIGRGKERPLSRETTLFARYVVAAAARPAAVEIEDAFLTWAAAELASMGIRIRKALCGKTTALNTPAGPIPTRSLLLANLTAEESLRLQRQGLGPHRAMGCGIFIPHKGIEAVAKSHN